MFQTTDNKLLFLTSLTTFLSIISCYSIKIASHQNERKDHGGDLTDKDFVYGLSLNQPVVIPIEVRGVQVFDFRPQQSSQTLGYLICQVHTQFQNVTLSSKQSIHPSTSVYGRDLGIITNLIAPTEPLRWYVYNNDTETVNILIHLSGHTNQDPMPGGCNEEFDLENDPNIHLHLSSLTATVQYQWANVGRHGYWNSTWCEKTEFQTMLQYEIYVYYIQGNDFTENTFFSAMKKLMLPEKLNKYAAKVKSTENSQGHKSLQEISSYNRQGVIYTILVKQHTTSGQVTMATYVPIATYSCTNSKDCQKTDLLAGVLSIVGGLVGIFLCFLGHRFFKTSTLIFGFLAFSIIFYQVLLITTQIQFIGVLALTGVFGLIGGALFLAFWWYAGIPVLTVLLHGLLLGYLFASILFYTPFGNLTYWDSAFNYGMSFTCAILIVPVLLLCFTRMLNIICCVVLGSFGVIVTVDTFLNSGLRYIVLNSFRHVTSNGYLKVLITGPFTLLEIILTSVGFLLIILGSLTQYIQERKKAPFPPCPRVARRRTSVLRDLLRGDAHSTSSQREPLLRGDNHRTRYGAVNGASNEEVTEDSEKELLNPNA